MDSKDQASGSDQPIAPPASAEGTGMDRRISRKRWGRRRIAAVAVIAAVVIATAVALFASGGSRRFIEKDQLAIAEVTHGQFQEYTPVSGSIQPIRTFYLDAVEGGRVETRFVEAGAFVKKGDPLIRLVNTSLQLDVMYREALSYEQINNARNTRIIIEQNSIKVRQEMADVELGLQRAGQAFRRDSALAVRGLVSQIDFTKSADEYEYWLKRQAISHENARQDSILRVNQIGQLEESMERLAVNVALTRKNLDNLTIRAPISGQLSALNAEIGQSRSPGERLGQIDVIDSFKVRVAMDEFYITRVSVGQTGEFELAGRDHRLVVTKVYPEVREGRFEIDMMFAGTPPAGIRRGQTLQIRIDLSGPTEATLLSRGGFVERTGGQWVYAVDPSGAFATKRSIRIGRQNPQAFEVLSGLKPGERVVTSSYDGFGDVERLDFR